MTGSTTRPKDNHAWRKVTKVCTGCGIEKTANNFHRGGHKDWRKLSGEDPRRWKAKCKDCTRAVNAAAEDPNFRTDRTQRPVRGKVPTHDPSGRAIDPSRLAAAKRKDAASYKRQVRSETRIKILEYLAERGCEHCGEHDPRVLEFDHINTKDKYLAVSVLTSRGHSWSSEKLRKEIRECRVLCANCHRLHTVKQQGYYSGDDVSSALRRILSERGIKDY